MVGLASVECDIMQPLRPPVPIRRKLLRTTSFSVLAVSTGTCNALF